MKVLTVIILISLIIIPFVIAETVEIKTNVVDLYQELRELGLEIVKGNIQGHSTINKFGANDAVGTAYATIWDTGGVYRWKDQAVKLNVSSESIADTYGSTGAWSVEVQGLDANYNLQTELINLTGQTEAQLTGSFLRVFRMKVIQSGSGKVNAGNIHLANSSASSGIPVVAEDTMAQITAAHGQTLMALYTVPAGKTAYMSNTFVSGAAAKVITYQLFAHPFGGSDNLKFHTDIKDADVNHYWGTPLKFTEKTDIFTQAKIVTGTTRVAAGFDIILVDN